MRRKDKEITDRQAIEEILEKSEVIRMAMVDNGKPYLVALNHTYIDGCLYVHSAKEGRKIDIIRKNDKVAFQADIDAGIVIKEDAARCTTRYQSVFGTGRALLLDDRETKVKALDAIMTKHAEAMARVYPDNVLDATLIIKIEIESLTGKKSGY